MTKQKNQSKILLYLSLIILPSIIYLSSLSFDFVWDDSLLYINQKNFPKENVFENYSKFWSPNLQDMYIPVTYTFWAIAASIGTDASNQNIISPGAFHFFNILFHILNGILVFAIVRRLIKNDIAALIGALVFALHPIQVEAVAWVSELRGLLAAFWGFLSIYFYLNHLDSNDKKHKIRQYIMTFVCLVLSMLSKPSAIVFPFMILLIDYIYSKRVIINNNKLTSKSKEKNENKKVESLSQSQDNVRKPIDLIKSTILFFVLIIPFMLIAKGTESKAFVDISSPLWAKPFIYLDSFSFYFLKIILPVNFAANYGISPKFMMGQSWFYLAWLLPIALIVLLAIKKEKLLLTSALIFLIGFLPLSGLISFYYQYFSTVADRYVYISMFATALAIAYGITKVQNINTRKLISFGLPILLMVLSFIQLSVWKNETTLWDDVVSKYPDRSAPSHNAKGMNYLKTGDFKTAIPEFSRAISLDPKHPDYYYNRGISLLEIQRYELAIADFDRVINLNPKYSNALFNKAMALSEMNKTDEAIIVYTQTSLLEPNQSDIYSNRGILYAKLNKFDSAAADFKKAIQINPKDFDAQHNLDLLKTKISK
jgi:tetratricopeptide (TPR) repeat protein